MSSSRYHVSLYLPFIDLELDGPDVTPGTFLLPTLASKLQGFAYTRSIPEGLMAVSGLEPQKYSAKDKVIIFPLYIVLRWVGARNVG